MIHLQAPSGRMLHTDSTPQINKILEDAGFKWFEQLKGILHISEDTFKQIDLLISPKIS